ncbi:xanthine dehydrogenase family protein subunit M [Paenibacillus tarimensis]
MISYDFEYYRPATVQEAVQLHRSLREQNKQPVYYTGGTEITTLGRINEIVTGAVIDLKGIPECQALQTADNQLVMGAALSFSRLIEANPFPLLSLTIREVADHTARSNITLGGNVCGNIIYREAVLPLLLTDSQVMVAGESGMKPLSIHQVFRQQVQLRQGEFLVQFKTTQSDLGLPYASVKKRRQGRVGYPLITVAAIKKDRRIRMAVSGLCSYPFRDQAMEDRLNDKQLPGQERIEQAVRHIPSPVLHDFEGSAEYRLFAFKNTLLDICAALEGDEHAEV